MKSFLLESNSIKKNLFWLMALSFLIRTMLAWILDLGSNEAYYWTYGKFPELSHIDHPPMIGWIIQLFTVNLAYESELTLRLASIIIGTINTWIVFIIGRRIKNDRTGLYAAILYTASFYCSIFAGTFINPDTPQTLFILLSIYFLHEGIIIKYETCEETRTLCRQALLLAGIFLGLAMLSKYSSFLIWAGAFVYILSSNRKLLKEPFLYLAVFITSLFLFPVLIWNIETNFISFEFQSSRLPMNINNFNLLQFLKSIGLVMIYNNPVSIIIFAFAIARFRKDKFMTESQYKLLLSLSLPFILFFTAVSLFSEVKSNWSAPGFFPLMFIAAAYLEKNRKQDFVNPKTIPSPLSNSLLFLLLTIFLSFTHYFSGLLVPDFKVDKTERIGNHDFTLEFFGWRTLSNEFREIRERDLKDNIMSENSFILSSDWANAAHSDFYLASPNKMIVKTIGEIEDTRKYAWITGEHGTFKYGESAYYIESSRDFPNAENLAGQYFSEYQKIKSIYIKKLGKPVLRFNIYRLKNLNRIPDRKLSSFTKY